MNNLSAYEDCKHTMKTGDVLLWRSNSLIGAAIRFFTRSEINHASMIIRLAEYEGEERRCYHSEALERGVFPNVLSKRLAAFDGTVWWYQLLPDWDSKRTEIGRRMIDMMGTPYDYPSLFANIVGRVSADARRLFCSEYCYLALGYAGKAPQPHELPKLGIFELPRRIL